MGSRKNAGESPKPIGEPAVLALADLTPGLANREVRVDEDLKALAKSIGEVGLIYPIVVKADPEEKGRYRIIAGERRWRALKHLKLEAAPCIVVEDEEDSVRSEVLGVVENHQRRNLTPLEEASAVRALLDAGYEPAAVARSLGRSRAWVARRSSLTELSECWLVEAKNPESKISEWPPSHLETIARFPQDVQDRMLEHWSETWGSNIPTLRDLEAVTGRYVRLLGSAPWKLEDGGMVVAPRSGGIRTKAAFGDVQLHLEFRSPSVVKGTSQGRGNSGVFFMGLYEVQVLDSYNNPTYVNGQAGAVYKQHIPLVNASRPPGEWQTYDIVFVAQRFAPGGVMGTPARITMFHNGVLVQHDVEVKGPTANRGYPQYKPHAARLPLELQDHGDLVGFRNIWVREITLPAMR